VHHGLAVQLTAQRQVVLDAAYGAHPERFVRRPPASPRMPPAAWINRPAEHNLADALEAERYSTSTVAPGGTIDDRPRPRVPLREATHRPRQVLLSTAPSEH